MSKTVTIDFSTITQIQANGINLSALYLKQGVSSPKLVWAASQEIHIILYVGSLPEYEFDVIKGTTWKEYFKIEPTRFGATADGEVRYRNGTTIYRVTSVKYGHENGNVNENDLIYDDADYGLYRITKFIKELK